MGFLFDLWYMILLFYYSKYSYHLNDTQQWNRVTLKMNSSFFFSQWVIIVIAETQHECFTASWWVWMCLKRPAAVQCVNTAGTTVCEYKLKGRHCCLFIQHTSHTAYHFFFFWLCDSCQLCRLFGISPQCAFFSPSFWIDLFKESTPDTPWTHTFFTFISPSRKQHGHMLPSAAMRWERLGQI